MQRLQACIIGNICINQMHMMFVWGYNTYIPSMYNTYIPSKAGEEKKEVLMKAVALSTKASKQTWQTWVHACIYFHTHNIIAHYGNWHAQSDLSI